VALPERRVELYQKYVETLLKSWNLARGLDGRAGRDLDVIETVRLLAPLALWMQETSPGKGLVRREAMRRQLVEICARRELAAPEQEAERLIADMREHAGLLLERGPGEYGFIHLTFQEYLAAVAIGLAGQGRPQEVGRSLAGHVDDDNWREVILLTVGYIGIIQQQDQVAGQVAWHLVQARGRPGQGAVLAGEAILDAWPGGVDPQTRRKVIQILDRTTAADRRVPASLRAAAGNLLARLGDPRPGLGTVSDLQFCHVPAGPFSMGSSEEDELAYAAEKPLHRLELAYDYWIGRYPVTVAQFGAFVADGGYKKARYWPEAQASGEWRAGQIRHRSYTVEEKRLKVIDEEMVDSPYDFGDPFNLPNHPVVGINWYEALAFCRWLEEQLVASPRQLAVSGRQTTAVEIGRLLTAKGYRLTLPSEAEWEKAARGAGDWRRYPWGDQPDPNKANYHDTGLEATSAVGCFSGGASPYGCEEMSGNVWEWTRSLWGREWARPDFGYPYNPADGREDLQARTDVLRVLRGGSFALTREDARCAVRHRLDPAYRNWSGGFRVVLVGVASIASGL
jgi:formylglycine-generating enzyme required for sulfatase activity